MKQEAHTQTFEGVPIYTQDQLRKLPVVLGQRFAVHVAANAVRKAHMRGPYVITWVSGSAYRAEELHRGAQAE